MTAKVVSFINLKGGVGKSTLSMMVSEYLYFRFGKKVLGCVDISPQPNESGGEMKEAQISGVQLLKPGEDTAVMLYFVDEAFHQVTLPVQISIVGLGFLPVGARRYDRTHALFQDVLAKLLGVIPFVSQHILTCITVYQPLGLRDVVLLTPSQDESQGIA